MPDRTNVHGDSLVSFPFIQSVKEQMRAMPRWEEMTAHQRECLEMAVHKIGRALTGDPAHRDHWHDGGFYLEMGTKELSPERARRVRRRR